MTNGIVFILHSPAEAARAADLAAALSPLVALPMPISGDRQAAYGSGALCVVLLDAALAARPGLVTGSAPVLNTILCMGSGVAMPSSLAGYTSLSALPTLESTAGALRELMAQKQCQGEDQMARSRRTAPVLGKRAEIREGGKNSLVARSAWGLVATVAVVSVAAPAIGDRAGASAVSADLDRVKTAHTMSEAQATSIATAVETEPQDLPPPPLVELLDHVDRAMEPLAPASVPVVRTREAVPVQVALLTESAEAAAISVTPDALIVVSSADAPRQATAPLAEASASIQQNTASEPVA